MPDLLQRLGFDLLLLRGGALARSQELLARVQEALGWTLSEECFPKRLSYRYRAPRASLVLLQRGRCIIEFPGKSASVWHLKAAGENVAVMNAGIHDITVTQAPFSVVRIVLPLGGEFGMKSVGCLRTPFCFKADLSLLLPMQRILEQALQPGTPASTRNQLGHALVDYVCYQVELSGCEIHWSSSAEKPHDPLLHLESWLRDRLEQPLHLNDLAQASALSARRLQELCKERLQCTPMDWLRSMRLDALSQALRDSAQDRRSIADLLKQYNLPESVATRRAFSERFGSYPSDYRHSRRFHQ